MGIGDMLQAQQDAEDARRYRWLKSRYFGADFRYGDPPEPVLVFTLPARALINASLDRTVDESMRALTVGGDA